MNEYEAASFAFAEGLARDVEAYLRGDPIDLTQSLRAYRSQMPRDVYVEWCEWKAMRHGSDITGSDIIAVLGLVKPDIPRRKL